MRWQGLVCDHWSLVVFKLVYDSSTISSWRIPCIHEWQAWLPRALVATHIDLPSTLFNHFHHNRETGCSGDRTTEWGSKLSAPFFTLPTMTYHRRQTTTPATTCPTLCDKCAGSFTSHRIMNIEGLWDGTSGLSSLSEKTRESNHLQI